MQTARYYMHGSVLARVKEGILIVEGIVISGELPFSF
jgi:hypothetical protein